MDQVVVGAESLPHRPRTAPAQPARVTRSAASGPGLRRGRGPYLPRRVGLRSRGRERRHRRSCWAGRVRGVHVRGVGGVQTVSHARGAGSRTLELTWLTDVASEIYLSIASSPYSFSLGYAQAPRPPSLFPAPPQHLLPTAYLI